MISTKFIISEILKKNSIVGYLAKKNINPAKYRGGGLVYRCPLHGTDRTPSFFVDEVDGCQLFYCFGCKAGGSVIYLHSELEHVTIRDSIKFFGKDISCNINDILDSLVAEISAIAKFNPVQTEDLLDIAFLISTYVYEFLRSVGFNKEDVDKCDQMFKMVDNCVYGKSKKELNDILDNLPSMLKIRKEIYDNRSMQDEQKEANEAQAWQSLSTQ